MRYLHVGAPALHGGGAILELRVLPVAALLIRNRLAEIRSHDCLAPCDVQTHAHSSPRLWARKLDCADKARQKMGKDVLVSLSLLDRLGRA